MIDRMLDWMWNSVVLGLIVVLGAGSLAMTYLALLELVSKRLQAGITPLCAGAVMGGAVMLLLKLRNDLIGARG